MILSQPELREAVAKGEIKFEPSLEERQWGPASIDLRLGYKFTKWRTTPSARFSLDKGLPDINGLWSEIKLNSLDKHGKSETYPLDAGDFILVQVYEKLWMPNHLIALVEGRSRYARTGISNPSDRAMDSTGVVRKYHAGTEEWTPKNFSHSCQGYAVPVNFLSIDQRSFRRFVVRL
jgi:deoxycytidine triphosphate deaminase